MISDYCRVRSPPSSFIAKCAKLDNLPTVALGTKSIGLASGLCLQGLFLSLILFFFAQNVEAQPPLAFDDEFDVLAGEIRRLVDPSPLENDTDFEGEDLPPDSEIEVLSQVQHGSLIAADDGNLTYDPEDGFTGTDSFTYRVVLGTEVSNEASVTLHVSGCTSNPPIFFCHLESSYKEKLAALGYAIIEEGFEDDDVWGGTRSPNKVPSINHRGIIWTSNHDMPDSGLSTSTGPPRTGQWGVFSNPHGDQRTICNDPDVPHLCPPMYDGFRGARRSDGGLLYGAGGWYTGIIGGHVELVLDGDDKNPTDVGWVGAGHRFFGVIDVRGFTIFELRETEGRSEDQKYIFADDFSIGFGPHTVQVKLRPGLNMFAYPVAVVNDYTSFDLIKELGSPTEVDRLMRYDLATQRFQTTGYANGRPAQNSPYRRRKDI